MLKLHNLSLTRGTRVLYSGATVAASSGERIGLVGENGSGKSTLFAAVLQEITSEAGDIESPALSRIAHVAQTVEATDKTALDYVLSGHTPLVEAKRSLAALEGSSDDMALAQAYATLAELNEGAVISEAKTILSGLGFTEEDSAKKVADFSGGWRNRLALAKALLLPSDLILLDEPTNHLDLDSIVWLESWLKDQEATVITISHDREFLDRTSQAIWAIEDGTIRRYTGNYSDYEIARAEKLRLQASAAKTYERVSAHLQDFIDRFRYKATKAKQAQARIKMLEKLQAVEPVRAKSQWRFEFPEPDKTPEHLIVAEKLDCGYGETKIIRGAKMDIRAHDRIGILGINGAGKSTFIKTLCGVQPSLGGEIRYANGVKIGYFAQHQLDQLRGDETPLKHLQRQAPLVREQDLRNFLGGFKFSSDMATSPVAPMSGGEKARLALALIAWEKPNILVLDEPTNHLDMETREALTMALSSFAGAVLLVSHDRHLLRATCDDLWLVHNGELSEYHESLDDYVAFVLQQKKLKNAESSAGGTDAAKTPNKKEQRRLDAEERARINALKKPLLARLKTLEKKMQPKNTRLAELEAMLADPDFYAKNADEVAAVTKEHGELKGELDALEEEWLEVSEEIEAIA
jgi:ATP-binding cassette subfamily F protein 3